MDQSSAQSLSVGFTTNPLDRLNNHRHNESFLRSLLESPESVFLLFKALKPLLVHTVDERSNHKISKPVWLPRDAVRSLLEKTSASIVVLLGSLEGRGHYAIDVKDDDSSIPLPPNSTFTDLMFALNSLSTKDCAILAQARGLMEWHHRHPFCSRCASSTTVIQGGVKRLCSNEKCKQQHYPRNDPCVIMLVVSETHDRFVMARKKVFPQGMYTVLAGFLDQGESAEESVKREVLEEVGLWVDRVEYIASQPWPLPFSQIMLGFVAYARYSELTIDKSELEEARWFTRAELTEALTNGKNLDLYTPSRAAAATPAATAAESTKPAGEQPPQPAKPVVIRTPPPWAIAHSLIEHYLAKHPEPPALFTA